MGKRKIGEIYNKPIVTGDKNLVTKNEVHKDELGGSSNQGIEYLDIRNLSENPKKAIINLAHMARAEDSSVSLGLQIMPSLFLTMYGATNYITAVSMPKSLCITKYTSSTAEKQEILGFEDAFKNSGWVDFTIEKYNSIPRITEEEFYSL